MSRFRSLLLLSVLWIGITPEARGVTQFFDYEIPEYPVAAASCQLTADKLGERLKAQTGLEVYQASCSTIGTSSSNIKITYLAEAALSVESTDDRFSGMLSLSRGLYKSRAACAADLPNQVDLFRKGTELEPFVAYCFQAGEFADEPYNLRIEAFGESVRHPYLVDAVFFKGRSLEDTKALGQQIFDAVKKQGADVAFAAIVREWPYYKVVLRYYSDIRISLSVTVPMTFDSVDKCAEGKAALAKINQQANLQPLALFCSAWPGQTAEVMLNQVSLRSSGISQLTAPDSFPTLVACQQKLPLIETLYRETFKRNVVGSHCDGAKGVYRAQIFTKGKAPSP